MVLFKGGCRSSPLNFGQFWPIAFQWRSFIEPVFEVCVVLFKGDVEDYWVLKIIYLLKVYLVLDAFVLFRDFVYKLKIIVSLV